MEANNKNIIVNSTGDGIESERGCWNFSGKVAENFDVHASKSIPLYKLGHNLTVKISDFFIKEDSVVYELGTSTGTLLRELADRHSHRNNARFFGIDVEPDMISFAREAHKNIKNLYFEACKVETFHYEKSDFITSHYAIQFIEPKHRQALFNKIYEALNWGGAFVLFEKVRASDARFQDMFSILYSEFKMDNGYDLSEILSKTLSLKGVMEPFSSAANVEFMSRAGFQDIISIQKYLCFEGWLAIK